MTTYLTAAGYGEAEYVDKKSRFIGHVWPVSDESEAMTHINETRSLFRDATHNVWAYNLRSGAMRWSDDGEPGGTSGRPTLNVFRAAEIVDVCCVVTRYFGGILLGSGGLVRAYSNAAQMALEASGIRCMSLWRSFSFSCSYSQFEPVKRLLDRCGAVIENAQYGADISVSALIKAEGVQFMTSALTEFSAGTISVIFGPDRFCGEPVNRSPAD